MRNNIRFDSEGNPTNSRADINKEIEEIEVAIQSEQDPDEINRMRSRWNYLMSL